MHKWPKDTLNRDTFRLIGDAVRGEYRLSKDFSQRVMQPLAQEPIVLAPRRSAVKRITDYSLSVAASLSAIALVGGIAFFNNPPTPQPEIVKAPNTPPAAGARSTQLASVPNDGTMNEYLIAHQEFSSITAILGHAPYLRSVSGAQPVKGCQRM
ncbi:MAG: hypothetical protein HYU73_22940 [Betaproteobacteria bacterium]|nr:hypothetical protein [Betaproteobacteria bacterium]